MTYQVNLKDSGLAMLIGQLNYDHNPYTIPHEDTWDKAVISKWDTIPGMLPIASRISPVEEWYGTEPVVFKKALVFSSNVINFKVSADDWFEVYIDGVKITDTDEQGIESANVLAEFSHPIEPEEHTIAFVLKNTLSGGHIAFAVYDGDELRSVSDITWPLLIQDGTYPRSEMVRIGWEMLTPENVEYKNIRHIPDGKSEWASDVLRADIGNVYSDDNYNDQFWKYAVERTEIDNWPLPDDQCLRIAPEPDWDASYGVYLLKKHINFRQSNIVVDATADDFWELYIDGVLMGNGRDSVLSTINITVTPGVHSVVFKSINGVGGPAHATFRITDGATTHRSDLSWRCAVQGVDDALINAVVGKYRHDVASGDDYVLAATDGDTGEALASYVDSTAELPDGGRRISTIISYGTANVAHVKVNAFPAVAIKNTEVTIVTKLDEYQVKEVDVKYDRILFNDLFAAVTPVKVRAINLNFDENGFPIADSLVLDELNRRYGLAMDSASVDVILDNHDQGVSTFHIQHTNDSLSYYGTEVITVINSLDVRVATTLLDGFVK